MGEMDKELDDYLSARKKSSLGFIKELFRKKKEVHMPEEVEVYKPEKKSIISMLKKEKKPEIPDEKIEDMKEIAKIALIAIKKIPDEKLAEFKKGKEFEQLKEILKKYNLIK